MDNAYQKIAEMAKPLTMPARIAVIVAIGYLRRSLPEIYNELPEIDKKSIYQEVRRLCESGIVNESGEKGSHYYRLIKPRQWLSFILDLAGLAVQDAGGDERGPAEVQREGGYLFCPGCGRSLHDGHHTKPKYCRECGQVLVFGAETRRSDRNDKTIKAVGGWTSGD